MHKIYLSRRNLLTLLSKLNRVKAGEFSLCGLTKSDYMHLQFPQTIYEISVIAIEDDYNEQAAFESSPTFFVFIPRSLLTNLLDALIKDVFDPSAPPMVQIEGAINVYAVPDDIYYGTANRRPGHVNFIDLPRSASTLLH